MSALLSTVTMMNIGLLFLLLICQEILNDLKFCFVLLDTFDLTFYILGPGRMTRKKIVESQ